MPPRSSRRPAPCTPPSTTYPCPRPCPPRRSCGSLPTPTGSPATWPGRCRARRRRQPRRGTRFHGWVEGLFGEQPLLDRSDLEGAADDDLVDDADLATLQAAFLAGPYAATPPHRVEAPFQLVLGGRVVRGRIDAVYLRPDGGYDVVDWKTGCAGLGPAAAGRLPRGLGADRRASPSQPWERRSTTSPAARSCATTTSPAPPSSPSWCLWPADVSPIGTGDRGAAGRAGEVEVHGEGAVVAHVEGEDVLGAYVLRPHAAAPARGRAAPRGWYDGYVAPRASADQPLAQRGTDAGQVEVAQDHDRLRHPRHPPHDRPQLAQL